MLTVPKAWGLEEVLVNSPLYCAKYLHIRPGWRCSEHYHAIKDETFIVVEGYCVISIDGKERPAVLGDKFHIPPNTRHWFGVPSTTESNCVLLEISTHHEDDDVVRLRPSEPYEGALGMWER